MEGTFCFNTVYNNNDDDYDDVSIRKPFLHSCMIISIIIIFKFLYLQSKSQKITCSRKEHVQYIMAVLSSNEVSFSCDGMSRTHTP